LKLPNAHLAVVPEAKIVDYLLCPWHRQGGPKSRFFRSLGFSRERWQDLAEALRLHARTYDVTELRNTPYGTSYRVEGILAGPDGRTALARTVWFVTASDPNPMLVSAYPCPEPGKS
jgi:hypothetical protein